MSVGVIYGKIILKGEIGLKRYDGILLCSDYDLTLTSNKHVYVKGEDRFACIPPANIAAVKEFVAKGGTFAMVSGRNPDEIEAVKEIMPIEDLCVCSNGTAVYSFKEHRAVVSFTMDESCLTAVRYFAARADKFDFLRITDNDFKFVFFRDGDDLDIVLKKPRFPVYKMIIEHFSVDVAKRHYEEALQLFSDRFSVEMSGPRTLEICPALSGKGEALKRMIPLLGKKFDKIVCVGDNQNDIGMIKFADIGYAVGNAIDALKAAADKVTVESSEGAVAAVISDLKNI